MSLLRGRAAVGRSRPHILLLACIVVVTTSTHFPGHSDGGRVSRPSISSSVRPSDEFVDISSSTPDPKSDDYGVKDLLSFDSGRNRGFDTSSAFDVSWKLDELNSDEPVEGCLHPAKITSIKVKDDNPKAGNVASNAIDGDISTRWAARGRNKWMELSFDGGEDGTSLIEGVAIAFFRGDRRVAFFDVSGIVKEETSLLFVSGARKGLHGT